MVIVILTAGFLIALALILFTVNRLCPGNSGSKPRSSSGSLLILKWSRKGNENPPPAIIELPSGERGNPEQES